MKAAFWLVRRGLPSAVEQAGPHTRTHGRVRQLSLVRFSELAAWLLLLPPRSSLPVCIHSSLYPPTIPPMAYHDWNHHTIASVYVSHMFTTHCRPRNRGEFGSVGCTHSSSVSNFECLPLERSPNVMHSGTCSLSNSLSVLVPAACAVQLYEPIPRSCTSTLTLRSGFLLWSPTTLVNLPALLSRRSPVFRSYLIV